MKSTTTSTIYSTSHHKPLLAVIVVLTALAVIMSNIIIILPSAFAIKRFYNCMTDIANKSGKLGIDDVTICYDKEYHTGPYFTHKSHSSGVDSSNRSLH
jgi:hypothetical protein